jgi:hypothetical protein
MLDTAYVITWRYSDGSGSGATAVFVDRHRAEVLLGVLTADVASRNYQIEPVAFDATPTTGAAQ